MRREGRLSVWATALTCAWVALMLLAIMPAPVNACVGAIAYGPYNGVVRLTGTPHPAGSTFGDGKTIVALGTTNSVLTLIPVGLTTTMTIEVSCTSTTTGWAPAPYKTSASDTVSYAAITPSASSTVAHYIIQGTYDYYRVTLSGTSAGSATVKFTAWRPAAKSAL